MSKWRKQLSYSGGIRKDHGNTSADPMVALRDPGNFTYGIIMRVLASSTSRWIDTDQYNDETLGDILEAALGLTWLSRHGLGDLDESLRAPSQQYFELIEQTVLACEKVIAHTITMGIWTDSRKLTAILI
jgi:hypothetical protein